jgi:hypothetical protein
MAGQERYPVLHIARIDDVVVTEHQHDVARNGAEVIEQCGQNRFDRGGWGSCRSVSVSAPNPGATVCSAAIT